MRINSDKCMNCGMCIEMCLHSAIDINSVSAFIDTRSCKGCKVCLTFECPGEAFEDETASE